LEKTEHQKSVEQQNKNTNLLLAANTYASFKQVAATKKLAKSLGDLNKEVLKQTEVLDKINSTQEETLDHTRRQTSLMEASNARQLLDRASKNTIFELKLALERIVELPDGLERYTYVSQLIDQIKGQGVTFESLPEISDKEYFHNALKELKVFSESSVKSITNEQYSDFRLLEDLNSTEITLQSAPDLYAEYQKEISGLPVANEFSMKKEISQLENFQKRKVTYFRSIVLLIVGFSLMAWGGENNDTDPFYTPGLILFIVGILFFLYRFWSGVFQSSKRALDGTNKKHKAQISILLKEKDMENQNKVKKKFDETVSALDFVTGEQIEVGIEKYNDFVTDSLTKVSNEIKEIQSKYPSISR
jgi:hypothetical protein